MKSETKPADVEWGVPSIAEAECVKCGRGACSFATMAAETLGLGSCMIGTVPPALQGDRKLKTKWGIPEKNFPSVAMTLGYPAVKFRNGIRRRFKSVEYI